MSKLNNTDYALLQTVGFYNHCTVKHVECGHGFTIGKNTITIEVNQLAWGYFEQALLKAIKERTDLKERNPELVRNMQQCPKCGGGGYFPIEVGSPEYEEWFKSEKESYDLHKENGTLWEHEEAPVYGTKVSRPCSAGGCQTTGIILKPQPDAHCILCEKEINL